MFDLTGKVAVITGSSKGIGKAIAEAMAKQGARVVVSSRKADVCEQVAAEINAACADGPGEAVVIPCNVSHKEQLENLVAETHKQLGPINVLVCNAAVNPYFGSSADIPDDAFDKIMDVNIKSNHWLCNLAIPDMVEAGGGSIIIVSSIGGLRGSPVLGAYAISKAADMQMVRNLAVEYGKRGIRANAIAPGLIRTDFARALWENPEILGRYEATCPAGRIGEPVEIAGTAVFLASDVSAFMTGQTLTVDGGVTIGQ